MLNMLIGILCDVVTRVTEEESESAAKADLEASVLDILECYDVEDDRHLRLPEFKQMMDNVDMQVILRDHDIDFNDLIKLEDVLFEAEGLDGEGEDGLVKCKELSFSDFVEKVVQLRGGNSATVTDIVELRGYLNRKFIQIEKKVLTTLPPPPSSGPGEPPPGRPAHAASSSSLAEGAPGDTPPAMDAALPGQIRPSGHGSDSSDASFQEAVLSQLSLLRMGQEMLRGEITDLNIQVQALQRASTVPPSGAVQAGTATEATTG